MGFDGFFFWRATTLLREAILGATINRVFLASDQELVFTCYRDNQVRSWLLSLRGHRPYFTLSNNVTPLNTPPNHFIQLLRHHIEGGTIREITPCGCDRILQVTIETQHDYNDPKQYHLYLELTGKITNLMLTRSDDILLDAWRRSGPNEITHRTLMPGALYRLPPMEVRKDPRIDAYDPTRSLAEQFHGFSPLLAHEFEYRMANKETFESLVTTLMTSTNVYLSQEGKREYHFLPLTHLGPKHQKYSWETGIALYHQEALRETNQAATKRDLLDYLKKEETRLKRRLVRLKEDFSHTEDAELWRAYGDAIFTYGLEHLEEKRNQIMLASTEDERQLQIPLDPTRTLSQNANRFYQKAQKARKSIPIIEEQQALVHAELAYLEGLHFQIEEADATALEQIREELRLSGRLPRPVTRRPSKQSPKYPPLRYQVDGVTISVGRNNLQNEYVTFTLARNEEWFFHVQGYPGSHVVLHTANPTSKQIGVAASLAAYYSKARLAPYVSVDYTQVRHVRKLPGGFPGAVLLKNRKTVQANPQLPQEKTVR